MLCAHCPWVVLDLAAAQRHGLKDFLVTKFGLDVRFFRGLLHVFSGVLADSPASGSVMAPQFFVASAMLSVLLAAVAANFSHRISLVTTKYRRKVLLDGVKDRLKSLIRQIAKERQSELIELEVRGSRSPVGRG